MNGPGFDAIDATMLEQRQAALDLRAGPRVGDFVQFPGEDAPRRFTHEWHDGLQTTCGPGHPCRGDVSFYLTDNGYCSFSGSLDSTIPHESLHDTGEAKKGRVWFFHHNRSGAGCGVNCEATFRVYEVAA